MKYFTLDEFFYSETANKRRINNKTNDQKIIENIRNLTDNLLDPLREIYGKPITISSGYRCKELNNAVGGVSTSQHVMGQASDLVVDGGVKGLKILTGLILLKDLPYDQVIEEGTWLHVSYRNGANRKQQLTYRGCVYRSMTEMQKKEYIALAEEYLKNRR